MAKHRSWLGSVPVARLALSIAVASAGAFATAQNELISVDSSGAQANGDSTAVAVTPDGRFVAFESSASNLVADDTNGWQDVFVRDRLLGTTELVSRNSNGDVGNRNGSRPSISADGRYVVFQSSSTNLYPGTKNLDPQTYVRDRQTGVTELVSVKPSGAPGAFNNVQGVISADGRYVAFRSRDAMSVGDTAGRYDIFVRDLVAGVTIKASPGLGGAEANDHSQRPSISADGRFVAFASQASNLAPNDNNQNSAEFDVFVFDRVSGVVELVSQTPGGFSANADSLDADISGDGSRVFFFSGATDLVPQSVVPRTLLVRDLTRGVTSAIPEFTGGPYLPKAVSHDGRSIAFVTSVSELPVDTNLTIDAYRIDVDTGARELLSFAANGGLSMGGSAFVPSFIALTADGRTAVYNSTASDLVAGDGNARADIFATTLDLAPLTFCTAGLSSNNCQASIGASGVPSASASSGFVLTTTSVDGARSGLYFYGVDNFGFEPTPWGAGSSSLCVKGPVQRTTLLDSGGNAGDCSGVLTLDWSAYIAANPGALGAPFAAGDRVQVQAWFRDPGNALSSSLSNALRVVLAP
jgi:Tol biopolymer transport system component